MKIVQISVSRAAIQARLPSAMSRGVIGVAYIAWKILLQTRPPMIGKVASNEADCIAVAASSPGARNTRYGTPPSARAVGDVAAQPDAHRGQEQDRREERR